MAKYLKKEDNSNYLKTHVFMYAYAIAVFRLIAGPFKLCMIHT